MRRAPGAHALVLVLALASLPCVPRLAAARDIRHAPAVRGLQPGTATLINQARERSATVRALVDVLNASDLVVYVDYRPYLDFPTACTSFLAAFGGHRYLLVSINPRHTVEDRIALLGHELEHAVEIAGAAEVADQETFRRFYLGRASDAAATTHYETAAARRAEEMVRRELQLRAGG
jgi:hypothetical protein